MRNSTTVSSRTIALLAAFAALGGLPSCRGAASAPPAPAPPPVILASPSPSAPASSSAEPTRDGGASSAAPVDLSAWTAARLDADGLLLGSFAVAAPPDAEHPSGVIAALATPPGPRDDVSIVTIDVARGSELVRAYMGPATQEDGEPLGPWIARAPRGVVYASQSKKGLELRWFDSRLTPGASRSLPGLGLDWQHRVRGFVGFDDRLIVMEDGQDTVRVRVFDEEGHPVTGRVCHGGFGPNGKPVVYRAGDEVVLDLYSEQGRSECAFHLHGSARWRENPAQWDGSPADGGAGLPLAPACNGLTASPWQEEPVGESWVVRTIACCGDESPSGLFVCSPPAGR